MSGCYASKCNCRCHVSQHWCCDHCKSNVVEINHPVQSDQSPIVRMIQQLTDRLDILEIKHRDLFKRVGELSAECESKRPYICPVCHGAGITPGVKALVAPEQCHSCEGKGIVWG